MGAEHGQSWRSLERECWEEYWDLKGSIMRGVKKAAVLVLPLKYDESILSLDKKIIVLQTLGYY